MKLAVMMIASVGLHLLIGWGLAGERPAVVARAPVELEIASAPPPPPPPPPPVAATTEPVRASAPRRRAARPMVAAAPVAADEPPVVVPDGPVDLDDDAPIAAVATPPVVAPSPPAVDRSRPPAPPDLDDALARQGARSAGMAVVRVRVGLEGRAEVLAVVSASTPELGDACRATVDGSRWRVALDRAGLPVVRVVSYRCAFEVDGW